MFLWQTLNRDISKEQSRTCICPKKVNPYPYLRFHSSPGIYHIYDTFFCSFTNFHFATGARRRNIYMFVLQSLGSGLGRHVVSMSWDLLECWIFNVDCVSWRGPPSLRWWMLEIARKRLKLERNTWFIFMSIMKCLCHQRGHKWDSSDLSSRFICIYKKLFS